MPTYREVQPYWSTADTDMEVWHNVDECPEALKIPVERLYTGPEPPAGKRHCTVCLFLTS